MKTDKLTPTVGIVVVLLSVFLYARQAEQRVANRTPSPALPVITSETQIMTIDEIHARLLRVLNETMPGNYVLDVDKDAQTITIDTWADKTGAAVPNAALHYMDYLTKWSNLVTGYVSLCGCYR
mgnify:CR=1 FL=1